MKNKKSKAPVISLILSFLILLSISIISWRDKQLSKESTVVTHDTMKVAIATTTELTLTNYISKIYNTIESQQSGLTLPIFQKAVTGFLNLKAKDKLNDQKDILTIVDFTKPSKEKRMWIIDLKNQKILLNTYVAHGMGSGDDMATKFSNIAESHQSSLGFYVTNETYSGKHGLSLRLDGFDKGINSMARNRAIVVHGADYVNENFINKHGRLGRSFGCPAVPQELTNEVINLIKNKTCLFINGNNPSYKSDYLNTDYADNYIKSVNNI